MDCPSGDQEGDPWKAAGPRVRRVAFDPSASASQMAESWTSCPARPDWNAIRRPSGECFGKELPYADSISGLGEPPNGSR